MTVDFNSSSNYYPPNGDDINFGSISSKVEYNHYLLSLNPIAYWRLGEPLSSTVAIDETTNHNGTYNNSPTLGETGGINTDSNKCVLFDKLSNENVQIPYHSDFNTPSLFSISFLMKATDVHSATSVIMAHTDPTFNQGWGVYIDGSSTDNLRFYVDSYNVTYAEILKADYLDGEWHQIVCTFDATVGGSIYLDGVLKDSFVKTSNYYVPTTLDIFLGIDKIAETNYPYTGHLDEVAFYNTELTSDNSLTLSELSKDGLYSNYVKNLDPEIYFRLGEAVGSTVSVDSTYHRRNGTYDGIASSVLGTTGLLVDDSDTCVYFNGASSEHTSFNSVPALISYQNPWSISFVYYVGSTNARRAICQLKTDGTYGVVLWQSGNRLYFASDDADTNFLPIYSVDTCLPTSTTNSVVLRFDGVNSLSTSSYSLYVDDVEITLAEHTASQWGTDINTHNHLGAFWHNGYPGWDGILGGSLDEFAIFNFELATSQVSDLYNLAVGNSIGLYSTLMIGNTLVENAYLGSTAISQIYLGSTVVFSK